MTEKMSYTVGESDPPVRDLTIGDALREAAADAPDTIAIIEGVPDPANRRTWTYAQYFADAETVARALLARYEPGDHIAIWAQNIPEWILLEMGCALAGMVVVTVNPAYQAHELHYVLTQSKAAALFVVDEYRGNPMLATAREVQPNCPDLKEIVRIAEWEDFVGAAGSHEGDLPEVAPMDTELPEVAPMDTELPEVAPMDKVMIQYTSGTTGFPKGALLHHRGLVNNGAHFLNRMGIETGDTYLTIMPLFHTAGSVMSTLGSISKRATNVLVETFDPVLVLKLMEEYKSAGLMGVPTMLVAMMEAPTFETTDLSSLKGICSGGSLVPEQMVKELENRLGAPFTIVFGQTECSPVSSMTFPHDTLEDKATTIGPPMPNVEVKIVDPETGETLPVGETGEYCARGYSIMHGYFDMPGQTAQTIDSEGWLHTGDLAAMDERGYCTVEGRLKDMIIRGGENIYPKELEELLFAHEAVGEVAVVGLPDDKWGEVVAAFVRPVPGHAVDKTNLFDFMRANLAPHKTPRHWFAVEDFPLTGSGKIQKFRLREQWQEGEWEEL
ncbi:MAG: AMP-binding protein [Actinomycetia bacterium]|nr:AMP-binding protein [Actinomycetes bacterium]